MQVKIKPSPVSGNLTAPASKSSMQRACAAALLHNGTTYIHNAGTSNDDKAALSIITQLGASLETSGDMMKISSSGFLQKINETDKVINCGESGLSVRMFAPIAALSSSEILLIGEGSLRKRSMRFFDKVFPELDVQIKSANGYLPLQLRGPLQAGDITVDGSLSSQFLTGLLFAFGASAEKTVTISVKNLKSKPYTDLTIEVMRHFGYEVINENYEKFTVGLKEENKTAVINYTVEGDWSSASFLLVAAAVTGHISLSGLSMQSSQADKAVVDVLRQCGAEVQINNNSIEVYKKELKGFTFDATDCPDLFPPLAALATYCKGSSVLKGTHRLAAKESDRAKTLKEVFGKMGIAIQLKDDCMIIEGGKITGAVVSSYNDHRIAMAAAVAALGAEAETNIHHAEAINKSYPQFFKDLEKLGASITVTES